MTDIIIKNGGIADGSGNPIYYADICIKNGRIDKIKRTSLSQCSQQEIDASGLVVSPGFIDVHTHADDILKIRDAHNIVQQGITTVVSGNCGDSVFPVGDFLSDIEDNGAAVNYATLVGHNTVRKAVMGMEGTPGSLHISGMKELVARAMEEGALGISTGLFYLPGAFAETEELIRVSTAAVDYGGIYASHIRSAAGRVLEAIDETLDINHGSKVPVHISHLKVFHKKCAKSDITAQTVLGKIVSARETGYDVTYDLHPFTATNTTLSSVVIPDRLSEGGGVEEKLKDNRVRAEIKEEVDKNISWMGGPEKIFIVECEHDSSIEGKTLAEAAGDKGVEPAFFAMDIKISGDAKCIFHSLEQEDVDYFIKGEYSMIASDGGVREKGRQLVHPRNYGTFPRVLMKYVNHDKSMTLEKAVNKMTFFPASRFGISERGLVAEGFFADLTLFNPATVRDNVSFEEPARYPDGIRYVIVNGEIVLKRKNLTGKLPGMPVRRK